MLIFKMPANKREGKGQTFLLGGCTWRDCEYSNQMAAATFTFTFTFSHLADAFIQSDLQGCIHILHLH